MNDHITRLDDGAGTAFATTPAAYRQFVRSARLRPVIAAEVRRYRRGRNLLAVSAAIRTAFAYARFPRSLAEEIVAAYDELGGDGTRVAVGNENTTGLPAAAWRPESFPAVDNSSDLLAAIRRCYAAAFSRAAIAYREKHGFDQLLAAPTVGVRPLPVMTAPARRVEVPARRIPPPAGARVPRVPETIG